MHEKYLEGKTKQREREDRRRKIMHRRKKRRIGERKAREKNYE